MHTVCLACHGSRIEKEYFGKNKGIPPDIHKQKYFKCGKCHKAEEMHGDGKAYANRYEVENGPECEDCHQDIYKAESPNAKSHWVHKDQVGCHVCHSMPYKNCYACHVGKDKNGLKYFKTAPSVMTFKIGLNPLRSEKRPEKFVVVRHIPVDRGTFDYYVKNGLSDFDNLPTWKMATPHNIRRKTPQNETCNACHGNKQLFLQRADVRPEYANANKRVVVPPEMVPAKRAE
jgi:thiosulfate/3-mercaptopyruvate sulfurtransferase